VRHERSPKRNYSPGAKARARDKLPHGGKGFADKALSKARRLARNKALSPWREFAYLCRAANGLEGLGAALPEIGLWPVAVDDKPDEGDLEKSARLVERLLAGQGNRQSAEARVAACNCRQRMRRSSAT
jgi:DNA phosphorothioation-dependent restriction protein DptH